jgi:hypothetical protein
MGADGGFFYPLWEMGLDSPYTLVVSTTVSALLRRDSLYSGLICGI